ncbi:hypothetical protein ACQ4WX_46590 [Streptomyces lasalocidi]
MAVITESGDVAPGLGQALQPAGPAAPAAQHSRERGPVDRRPVGGRAAAARFKTVLQGHVSRLRALLAEHRARKYGIELATHATAYELRMPESLVDAHRFEELVALSPGPSANPPTPCGCCGTPWPAGRGPR